MSKPSVQVELTPHFVRIVKRLRKRFPKISNVVQELIGIGMFAQGETPAIRCRVWAIQPLKLVYSKTDQIDISPEEIRELIDQFEDT
jgi:hypothetical protein